MRLSDLKENDRQLDEFIPAMLGAAGSAVGGAARAVGGAVQAGGAALAKGAANVAGAVGQKVAGLAAGGMDPAQAAQAKQQHDAQKKEIQDAIKAKQQEISDLQKQLSSLG